MGLGISDGQMKQAKTSIFGLGLKAGSIFQFSRVNSEKSNISSELNKRCDF